MSRPAVAVLFAGLVIALSACVSEPTSAPPDAALDAAGPPDIHSEDFAAPADVPPDLSPNDVAAPADLPQDLPPDDLAAPPDLPLDLPCVEDEVTGSVPDCPRAVVSVDGFLCVPPQTVAHLHGGASAAREGTIARWEWTARVPHGSASTFLPSASFPDPAFELNVAGTYVFCLDVYDDRGRKSCTPDCVEMVVACSNDITVELLWQTPGDEDETDTGTNAGSDLDLHFLHPSAPANPDAPDLDGDGAPDPYFDQPFDCYWFNPHPDWGAVGNARDDDPEVARDDTDGGGPEIITLRQPEWDTRYELAVHYWDAHGFGQAVAEVRVSTDDQLLYRVEGVRLVQGDLWSVAVIDWPSAHVTPVVAPDGGPAIIPGYRSLKVPRTSRSPGLALPQPGRVQPREE